MTKNNDWKFYHNTGTEIKLKSLYRLTDDISCCLTDEVVSTYDMNGFIHSYLQVALVNARNERVAQATVSMFGRLNSDLYTEQEYYFAFDTISDDVANMSHLLRHHLIPRNGLRLANAVNVFAIETERSQTNKEYLEQLMIKAVDYLLGEKTLIPTIYWLFDFSLDMSNRSELARQAKAISTSDFWKWAGTEKVMGFYSYLKDDGRRAAYRRYDELIFSI